MSVTRYTGWEMYPLDVGHRNDGNVYVKAKDYDELKALYDEVVGKYLAFPQTRIYRIPVNSPHDCDDPTSPPPFRDQKCKCKPTDG